MGKRKSKKVEVKKSKVPKLDKEFNCPFCNNVKTVGVRMNHRERLGHLSCRVCGVEYTSRIGRYDEAVDIYSNWIDKCYEVNNMSPEVVSQSVTNESGTVSVQKGDLISAKDGSGGVVGSGSANKLISFSMDEDVNEDDYLNENEGVGESGEEGGHFEDSAESGSSGEDGTSQMMRRRKKKKKKRRMGEEGGANDGGEEIGGYMWSSSLQPSNDDITERMKMGLDTEYSGVAGKSSGIFDISNLTKSSSMPKSSFTVNEDDGLFSD